MKTITADLISISDHLKKSKEKKKLEKRQRSIKILLAQAEEYWGKDDEREDDQ